MAKRVNTKFLVGLTAALVGGCIVAVILRQHWKHGDPRKHIEAAEDYASKGDWDGAQKEYRIAWSMDQGNKELWILRGDAVNHMTDLWNRTAIYGSDGALACWESALAIDPHYKPALQKLLDSYAEQTEYGWAVHDKLHDAATRLAKEDPTNLRAQAYVYIADLQEWQNGVGSTDRKMLDAIQSLADLQKKDPANANALYYLGTAKLRLARDIRRSGDSDKADAQLAELAKIVDATVAAQPQNADVNFRASEIYDGLQRISAKSADADNYRNASRATIAQALKLVKPDDRHDDQIHFYAAEQAQADNKPSDAEKILREYYQQHPNDENGRYQLADVLRRLGDPAKRDEAVNIFKQSVVPQHEPGVRGLLVKIYEQQAREELVRLRVDKYVATTQPSERTQLATLIDDGLKQVKSESSPQNIGVMRLEAEVLAAKGQSVAALQVLAKAVDLMEHTTDKPPYQFELINQLAVSYKSLGQNRAAEERFQQVLQAHNTYLPARINLIELYLQERNIEEAKRNLDILAAQSPQLPQLTPLRLGLARLQGNTEAEKQAYTDLPEDTATARAYKVQQAWNARDFAEVLRLQEPDLKEKPNDVQAAMVVAGAYFQQNNKEKAIAILNDSLAKNPNESRLKLAIQQINGATPEEQQKFIREQMLAKDDPFSKEVYLARSAGAEGRWEEALQHLKNADAIKPNDMAVWQLYFEVYRRKHDYASAQRAIEVIAPLDNDTGGRQYRWQLAVDQRQYAQAIKIARELTEQRGAFSGSWTMLAKSYQAAGQFGDAIGPYRTALDIQNMNSDAYRGLARCYHETGQPDQEHQTLVNGYQHLPNDRVIREMLLTFEMDHGNAAAIIAEREKDLKQFGENAANYYALAGTYMAAADQIFAKDLEKSRQYLDKARENLSIGVKKFPKDLQLNAKLAELLQKTATFEEGQKVLTDLAALDIYKGKPEPLVLLAEYSERAGKADDAEQYLRQALAASGNQLEYEVRLAQHLLNQKKYDRALDALQANADDPNVVRARLQTLVLAGRLSEAEKGVDAELAKSPNTVDMLLLRLGIYVDQHRYREARDVCKQVLALNPKSDRALYFQALTEIRDPNGGDLELATQSLNTVILRDSGNLAARVQLADVYRRRHQLDAAAQQLEECLKKDKENREVRLTLLDLYMATGNVTLFEQTVNDAELNPKLNSDPVWFRVHAQELAKLGAFDKAIDKIQLAMTLGKGNPQYDQDFLDILLQSKAYDRVLTETDAVLKNNGANGKTWWLYRARGLARAALGDKPMATEQFNLGIAVADAQSDVEGAQAVFEALGSSLGYDQAIFRLASRLNASNQWRLLAVDFNIRNGNWQGVLDTVQPLLDQKQALPVAERIKATQFAAEAYQLLGQSKKNEAYLNKSKALYLEWLKEINPNDRLALNNMAYLLAEAMNNPKEARQYSQRAYDAEKRNGLVAPGIADTHGWVLTLCGGSDADEGLTLLRQLVQNNPDFVEARYHLGMALLKKHRPQEAQTELTTAAEMLTKQDSSTAPELKAHIDDGLRQAREMSAANAR
jgi:tetratricopeptide (TPR) repeat protein/predicted Zn-dependent protease